MRLSSGIGIRRSVPEIRSPVTCIQATKIVHSVLSVLALLMPEHDGLHCCLQHWQCNAKIPISAQDSVHAGVHSAS